MSAGLAENTRASAFTSEIIQNSLQAIATEMFDSMALTAMSPVIYEVFDMGTGIVDPRGESASSGAGIPILIGVADKAVRSLIHRYSKPGQIEEGDIFITNDPVHGGSTHLNDVTLAMPVFADGEVVAWAANCSHWNDLGGSVPGSMSIDATEIFQEGLRLPAIKLVSRGEINQAVLEIIKANTRTPDFSEGDMWAGVASVRCGARRLRELVQKFGRAAFAHALDESMDLAEKISLAALAKLPKGRFALEELQDDGLTFKVSVEIGDAGMTLDLRDNPDSQPGPINLNREGAEIAAQLAFKSLTSPSTPANGGTFRPLTVLTRPGSMFQAPSTAPMGFYAETIVRLHDLVLQAVARQVPERICAGTFSSICTTFMGGHHPDTKRPFYMAEPELGGWGATFQRDGNHAIYSAIHGDTFSCPVEVAETRFGLQVERRCLNPVFSGAGQFNGGRGVVLEYRMRADGGSLTCSYSRSKVAPWGLSGGHDGSVNYVEVERTSGDVQRLSKDSNIQIDQDDIVRIVTANGAGYGDPKARTPSAVRQDVRNGYVTPEQALDVYGVQV